MDVILPLDISQGAMLRGNEYGFLLGSILPKPIIEKATTRPFANQLLARLCLAAVGIVMILALRTVP
jgi:hypothetical protein